MSAAAFSYVDQVVDFGTCCACGIRIGAPSSVYRQRRDDHKTFYCINGHAQYYKGQSDAERLRDELEAEKQRTERAEARAKAANDRAEHEERRARAARGQVTRIKNRVGNGVCPCCNRTFQNLQQHMHTKHPGYAHEVES